MRTVKEIVGLVIEDATGCDALNESPIGDLNATLDMVPEFDGEEIYDMLIQVGLTARETL